MATTSASQRCVIIPGLYDSGDDHWQTWLERRAPGATRILIEDWSLPNLDLWASAIVRTVNSASPSDRVFLVAHSFGCLAGYAAARRLGDKIAGTLFVAPSDPLNVALPDDLFDRRLKFPSVVVGSEDDPWMSFARARSFARNWGSSFVNAGFAGHINVASGFGPWPEGQCLLQSLMSGEALPAESLAPGLAHAIPKPCYQSTTQASLSKNKTETCRLAHHRLRRNSTSQEWSLYY